MKKIITIIVALVCVITAQSQIVIQPADMGGIGYSAIQVNDTLVDTVAIHTLAAGANLNWNFAGLHNSFMDTVNIVSPGSTPYASNFSTSNLAFTQSNQPGIYNYLYSDASSVVVNGQELPAGFITTTTPAEAVVLNPPQGYLAFPGNYMSYISGMTHYKVTVDTSFHYTYLSLNVPVDTMQFRYTTQYTSTFDAWGNVTTPLGTFPCLRQAIVQHNTDSLFAFVDTTIFTQFIGWTNITVLTDSTLTYRWFTNWEGFPLVELNMDTTWTKPTNGWYLKASNSSTHDLSNMNAIIHLYPNPATDEINIINTTNEEVTIEIYNSIGSKIGTQLLTDKSSRIKTNTYTAGLYMYRVFDAKMMAVAAGKFNIVR